MRAALALDLDPDESEEIEVELTAETVDGALLEGFDAIEFFRPGKGRGKNTQKKCQIRRAKHIGTRRDVERACRVDLAASGTFG